MAKPFDSLWRAGAFVIAFPNGVLLMAGNSNIVLLRTGNFPATAGWWNGSLPGSMAFGASPSASNGMPSCTRLYFNSPALGFASGDFCNEF